MNRLAEYAIRRNERGLGVPLDYLRTVARTSTAAFVKFGLFAPVAAHRSRAPTPLWHLARLAATREQDCGTCLQTVVNAARAHGVPAATLRAALADDTAALTDDERLALDYGRAVAARTPEADALVGAVRVRWGEAVLVELALGVATVQVFPVLKRGLGEATACALVQIRLDSGE